MLCNNNNNTILFLIGYYVVVVFVFVVGGGAGGIIIAVAATATWTDADSDADANTNASTAASSSTSSAAAVRQFTIPGTTQTYSGYDTETGTDAICWKSQGTNHTSSSAGGGTIFANDLVSHYNLQGRVQLLEECQGYNALTGYAPTVLAVNGQRLRTGMEYNYSVHIVVDTKALYRTSLDGNTEAIMKWIVEQSTDPTNTNNNNKKNNEFSSTYASVSSSWNIVSGKGDRVIAVQVILCEVTKSGFCSPFIHEESNARLAALNITKKPPYGERHGDSHVHSKKYFVTIPNDNDDGDTTTNNQTTSTTTTTTRIGPGIFNISVEIPVLVNVPGSFFAIAAAQIFVRDVSEPNDDDDELTVYHRYDMANAISYPHRYITVQEPAVILDVPNNVLIPTYVLIGIVSTVLLFILWQTIQHRHHSVFQLTQGPFLIVFICMALLASVSSFLLEPKNDLYCRAGPVLNILSMHLMYSITIGRLWRIYAVISPLLVQTRKTSRVGLSMGLDSPAAAVSYWDKFFTFCLDGVNKLVEGVFCCIKDGTTSGTRNLRRQVTSRQLSIVIALFAIPQILFQILGAVLERPFLAIEMNSDESRGRLKCSSDMHRSSFTTWYMWGVYMFILLVIILLGMASATRKLPSLLNETLLIAESTITTICLLGLGVGIIAITESPTTSPSVEYLVKVSLTNVFALNTAWRIIWPKLRVVWSGETILVSQLVSDHVSTRKATSPFINTGTTTITGWNPTPTGFESSVLAGESLVRFEQQTLAPSFNESQEQLNDSTSYNVTVENTSEGMDSKRDSELFPKSMTANTHSSDKPKLRFQMSDSTLRRNNNNNNYNNNEHNEHRKKKLKISTNTSPDRTLLLKMIDLQENMTQITNRIMTGLSVPEDDWILIRRMTGNLAHVFDHNVEFTWETSPSERVDDMHAVGNAGKEQITILNLLPKTTNSDDKDSEEEDIL